MTLWTEWIILPCFFSSRERHNVKQNATLKLQNFILMTSWRRMLNEDFCLFHLENISRACGFNHQKYVIWCIDDDFRNIYEVIFKETLNTQVKLCSFSSSLHLRIKSQFKTKFNVQVTKSSLIDVLKTNFRRRLLSFFILKISWRRAFLGHFKDVIWCIEDDIYEDTSEVMVIQFISRWYYSE